MPIPVILLIERDDGLIQQIVAFPSSKEGEDEARGFLDAIIEEHLEAYPSEGDRQPYSFISGDYEVMLYWSDRVSHPDTE